MEGSPPVLKLLYLLVIREFSWLWFTFGLLAFLVKAYLIDGPKPLEFLLVFVSRLFLRTIGSTDLLVRRGLSLGGCFNAEVSRVRWVETN